MSSCERKHALLLIGSPRVPSNSEFLGSALIGNLESRGWSTTSIRILPALRSKERMIELLDAVEKCDLLVLAMPLYADGPPAIVLKAFERIAEATRFATKRNRRLVTMMNCGFPEAMHNLVAADICRLFAKDAGFQWSGALAMGMGEAIGRKPLEKAGGMVRNIKKAIELAAAAINRGEPVPADAERLFSKSLMPRWLYIFTGNYGWKRMARRFGVHKQLTDRPF